MGAYTDVKSGAYSHTLTLIQACTRLLLHCKRHGHIRPKRSL